MINLGRTLIMLLWSVFLTAITGIFAGAPLKVTRVAWGAVMYWLVCLGLSALFWGLGFAALGALFLVVTVLVGIQTEMQIGGIRAKESSVYSVLITSGALGVAAFVWIKNVGSAWKAIAQKAVNDQLSLVFANAELINKVSAEDLVYQAPSIIVSLLALTMALTLIFEKQAMAWSGVLPLKKEHLRTFSMPEAFIWVFIAGMFLAFWQGGATWLKPLGMNLLNVAAVGYFFQGLAVVASAFEVYRVGAIWRVVFMTILVVQLFLLVSILGVVDFWADFRSQMAKKTTALKRKRISD